MKDLTYMAATDQEMRTLFTDKRTLLSIFGFVVLWRARSVVKSMNMLA